MDNLELQIDELTQGMQTLSYLGGKVRECDEEVEGLKKDINDIAAMAQENWKGYSSEAFAAKLEEVLTTIRSATDNMEETMRLLMVVSTQMEEEKEKAEEDLKKEKEKAEVEKAEGKDS